MSTCKNTCCSTTENGNHAIWAWQSLRPGSHFFGKTYTTLAMCNWLSKCVFLGGWELQEIKCGFKVGPPTTSKQPLQTKSLAKAKGTTWDEKPALFRGALRAPGESFVLIKKKNFSRIHKRFCPRPPGGPPPGGGNPPRLSAFCGTWGKPQKCSQLL